MLLLPLRAGAISWAAIILYSMAGGLFLFLRGDFFFFNYPEWQIYGGISLLIGGTALISAIAISNRSYIWMRVVFFLWPFVIVIGAIRAIIMLVELQRGQSDIQWECDNAGQLWTSANATQVASANVTMPSGFCTAGFSSLNTAFIFGLLIDIVFQLYMFFLCWRFLKRLEHYSSMKGPFYGGYYNGA